MKFFAKKIGFYRQTLAIFTLIFCQLSAGPVAASGTMPVPITTIYPGDSISSSSLRDRLFSDRFLAYGGYHKGHFELVGKIARRTLVRGKPIPLNAVREPFAIRNGQMIILRYRTGTLSIAAKAISLKSAAVGEFVQARNIDSGRTVSGTVQTDGSILVSLK